MEKEFEIIFGDRVEFRDDNYAGFDELKNSFIMKEDDKPVGIRVKIDIDDKEAFNEFKAMLAMFLTSIATSVFFHKYLAKKFSAKTKDSIIKNHLSHSNNDYYYAPLTKLLIDEYFRHNTKINLSTFLMFNMNGMEKDIKEAALLENDLGGKLIAPSEVSVVPGFLPQNDDEDEEFNLLVKSLSEGYKQIGHNKANETIHVYWKNGFKVTNNKYEIIDLDYIQKSTGLMITSSYTKGDTGLSMACFIIALEVLGATSVVIYKSLPEQEYVDVLENVDIYSKKSKKEISIYTSDANHPR